MIEAVKGMNDVLPGAAQAELDSSVWERVASTAADVLSAYGYRQVLLPVVEATSLFARSIGEDTDIVSKEMFTFSRHDESLSLRPEGTAGAARAYIEHNYGKTSPIQRWWYFGPMFRAERPQKGRYRQFYQVGAELFGVSTPLADVEMLLMVTRLCETLGVEATVRLNSLGDRESRACYRDSLIQYLKSRMGELCESCQGRVVVNPLRVLDCKRPQCQAVVADAPDILDSLSRPARAYFNEVQRLLETARLPYVRDPRLVRGLDYYTGTVFELVASGLGAQNAILGGGRYDGLVSELGGPPTPAVGFAAGIERLCLVVAPRLGGPPSQFGGPHLYIAPMPGAETRALALADEVRKQGPWRVEVDVSGGRLKQQLRRADRAGARYALVIGEDELGTGTGKLKDLRAGLHQDGALGMVELQGEALARALAAQTEAFPTGARR